MKNKTSKFIEYKLKKYFHLMNSKRFLNEFPSIKRNREYKEYEQFLKSIEQGSWILKIWDDAARVDWNKWTDVVFIGMKEYIGYNWAFSIRNKDSLKKDLQWELNLINNKRIPNIKKQERIRDIKKCYGCESFREIIWTKELSDDYVCEITKKWLKDYFPKIDSSKIKIFWDQESLNKHIEVFTQRYLKNIK